MAEIMIKSKKDILLLNLGADIFVSPGTAIVGGQAVFGKNFAENLSNIFEITVATLHFTEHRESYASNKYRVIEIPLPHFHYDSLMLWKNFDCIKKECLKKLNEIDINKFVVISVYWLSGHYLLQLADFNPIKWIHTFSSYSLLKSQEIEYAPNHQHNKCRHGVEYEIAQKTDQIWTTCKYEKNLVINNFKVSPHKCIHLPRAIDRDIFSPCKKSNLNIKWDILYLGRLDSRKGIYDIPIILKNLKTSKCFRVALVGGSNEEMELYKRWFIENFPEVLKKHAVEFFPAVEHIKVPAYLNSSSALLAPSHYEIFGNVVLEALSCGTPVVATNVGGIPELIVHGKNGYLFSRHDFQKAAFYLDKILGDCFIKNQMREFIINDLSYSKYTWQNLITKVKEIL